MGDVIQFGGARRGGSDDGDSYMLVCECGCPVWMIGDDDTRQCPVCGLTAHLLDKPDVYGDE